MHLRALLLWREAILSCALDKRATITLDANLIYSGSYVLEAPRCLVAWGVVQLSPAPKL
jgi:hypothetical protein